MEGVLDQLYGIVYTNMEGVLDQLYGITFTTPLNFSENFQLGTRKFLKDNSRVEGYKANKKVDFFFLHTTF